jgi:hypothetical protein
MEQVIFIISTIVGLTLSIVNVTVQNSKRTVNNWAREVLESGKIISPVTSEIGTIYSNPFANWFLEIDMDNRFRILRNSRVREKIREYKNFRKWRNILFLIFIPLLGLSIYLFGN